MEIESFLIDNLTGKPRLLRILFDTGAYMTVIDSGTLLRAGYNINKGNNAEFNVVGRKKVPAKEVLTYDQVCLSCLIEVLYGYRHCEN